MCSIYERTLANGEAAAEMVNSTEEGILVIRHSIRDPIPDSGSTFRMMLTEEGKRAAREMGSKIRRGRKITLFHSPVPRCGETARHILEGHGNGTLAGQREYLRCRYILDEDAVFKKYEDLGADAFISAWFGGRIDDKILEPPETARKGLLGPLILEDGEGIRIHVTHDWNILLLLGLAYDLERNECRWPGFLDAVLMEKKGGRYRITYHGDTRPVDI